MLIWMSNGTPEARGFKMVKYKMKEIAKITNLGQKKSEGHFLRIRFVHLYFVTALLVGQSYG